ncbi:MAG: methyltransferase [Proteobacteria bacterium]|nr:methyltransferase [Pseudomonadota bacterium]
MSPSVTRDRLTRDVWLYQRAKGHRFSSDDTTTALVSTRAAPTAQRILDLGCGIGTVLLHLAWTHREATLVGIEAQAVSFELLERNVAASGFGERITLHHGDLREVDAGTGFDLVTGTPPYFPIGTAVGAMDEQRAYARIEYRGGVEAYLAAGARALAADGVMVLCGDADADARVVDGARAVGLGIVARLQVIPRVGERPLFAVWTARHTAAAVAPVHTTMTLRDAAGAQTPEALALRAFSGL